MKRFVWLVLFAIVTSTGFAQSADSVVFMTANRKAYKLRKAEGYTISTTLFNSAQTISVIKFSPKHFRLKVVQPGGVATVSEMGKNTRSQFAINACFWAMKKGVPTAFVKSDGVVLSKAHSSMYPRVNGLVMMYDDHLEIVRSYDMPDYPDYAGMCDNICSVGPVLIDDGERVSYKHFFDSTKPVFKRQVPFFTRRHPRSAIGCDAEGNVYMVVVDGRAKGCADGVSIAQLTDICSWLGLVDAINLDGGGSSTLWCRKHGVINHPSGNKIFDHEGERRVSSSIVVQRRRR